MFSPGNMTHRPLPIPLMCRFTSGGHDGATPVGTVDSITPDEGGYMGAGTFFDPAMVPEVPRAVYLIQNKALGPSVDLDRDFAVQQVTHPTQPDKKAMLFNKYNVIGTTLVPMPAFHQVHMTIETPEEKALLASAGVDIDALGFFDVNTEAWKAWPVAPRAYKFDADAAVRRIAAWAGIGSEKPDLANYASTFLWRDGSQMGDTLGQKSFRLPLADIINGQPHLIYHAVYSAAALLAGAHGGIPRIPAADVAQAALTLNNIYHYLSKVYNDPSLTSPLVEAKRQAPQQPAQASIANDESLMVRLAIEAAESIKAEPEPDCGCTNVIDFNEDLPVHTPLNNYTVTTGPVTLGDYSGLFKGVTLSLGHTPSSKADMPADVLKSMDEERRPYNPNGRHDFTEDGICSTCGY